MAKIRGKFSIICLLLVCMLSLIAIMGGNVAFADSASEGDDSGLANGGQQTRLWTQITMSINGGDYSVWLTARNEFSLFTSQIIVILELYCSLEYQEYYTDMTLVNRVSVEDLNIFESFICSGSTNNQEKFWQGRVRYKIDGGAWESMTTGTLRYAADGTFLGHS